MKGQLMVYFMKAIVFLMSSMLIYESSVAQNKFSETNECKGIYWLDIENDQKNTDSVRVLATISAVQKDQFYKHSSSYLEIGGIKYKADNEGNFDFKIKPGTYTVYARNFFTYGITTEPIYFSIRSAYIFNFYLLAERLELLKRIPNRKVKHHIT